MTIDAPYDDVTDLLALLDEEGILTDWAAFEIVECRTFERTIPSSSARPQRWKKIAFIRKQPGVLDFRDQYSVHFPSERHHNLHSWKYRQNDVGRHCGVIDSPVHGVSEFWRHSEDLMKVYSRQSFVETDAFVDHSVPPLVIFGIEHLVVLASS